MAPITTEKRSQPQQQQPQPNVKDSSGQYVNSNGHGHNHTKENSSGRHHSKKKTLEILDFHESWLEEMEIYKDKMCSHTKQPLSGTHNHTHTPQCCQLISNSESLNTIGVHMNMNGSCFDSSSINTTIKRKPITEYATITTHTGKPRAAAVRSIMPNSSTTTLTPATAGHMLHTSSIYCDTKTHGNGNSSLLLKRPRDETTTTSSSTGTKSASGHTKRQTKATPHTNSQSSHGGQKNSKNGGNTATAATTPPHSPTAASSSPPIKPTSKVIVNQFHASSLLSLHQYDDKSKILTQNGLTKSAATAYETSLYASYYLSQDNRSSANSICSGIRYPSADHTTYIGVSLNKIGDGDRLHGGSVSPEEDPCAAIDDVNDYSDTDSEDEYTGHPFFLAEDGDETHQSRNIRYRPDISSSIVSEESEDDICEKPSEYYRPTTILTPSIFPNVPPYLNFSSHDARGPPMPPSLHKVLKWKLSPVMPRIVKRVVLNSGFRIIKNTTDWMAVWEKHMKSPGFRTIRSHQKYNHMPGSFRIGRKDSMWRSIYSNMKKFGTKEFGFMQRSYIMPDDLERLRQSWPKNASKLTKWIVKPPASARGTGIRIVNKWSQFPKDRPLVVQKYIERPLLINDNKFDMRIYVVVTSINPLRIYMYKDGLARFASVKYSSEITSLDDRCMHLTNYSINKFSENYSKNEDFNACQGHKWTLQSLWSCLESRGVNTKRLWATLRNLVIKAIISGESGLNRTYRQNVNFRYNCFELFGFDVLLDENLIPWLLEINISPSLHSELPLDLHVKGPLIQAVLNTALYQVPPKLNEKLQKEILEELKLQGPLCHDKRIFTTCLTAEEVRKHNLFTNRSIEFREEYTEAILDNLLPDDVRCLIVAEDEFARSKPLERIFPTSNTHIYLKYIDNPRYYNRLLDAWEHKYGHNREGGINILTQYCRDGYHLQVSDAALEKEPNVTLTEIDMMHVKKSEDTIAGVTSSDTNTAISANASKAGSPESNAESSTTVTSMPVTCSNEKKPAKDQTFKPIIS